MEKVDKIIMELEKVAFENNDEARNKIANICSELLNDNFAYENLDSEVADLIDDLSVMSEINGINEPAILHMKPEVAEGILNKLKKIKKSDN